MRGTLYFYRKTTYPTDADYYNITKGYAGYARPQEGHCLFAGTLADFEEWLDTRKRRSVRTSSKAINRKGV